ncbi:hypothetical protein EVAR_40303_1 [Eumeta japonica]|uniref:RNase H type-1 domain-containing protein n=1 Tax=Eumeta variegata TaxID=151549 RepID=A0A4C1YD80_EUMVA|nr:hypothetical protein EVAR_40303_1 [Eumeta japonica]
MQRAKTSGISLRKAGKCLFWVRAHAGTTGNERADELARNAALKKRQRITIAIRCRTPKGDQGGEPGRVTALHRGGTGEITKCFFPRVEGAYRVLAIHDHADSANLTGRRIRSVPEQV